MLITLRLQFSNLRIQHRFIIYLCETKSKLQLQRSEFERLSIEKIQLQVELEELEDQIINLEHLMNDEREVAQETARCLQYEYDEVDARYTQLVK
jgi:uncharacterized protein YlxW (UPF0749 family)